uniref:BTB domain-containing protein n=1 Tax=Panagrolaimus davidi TaxID=227884 RepID=A0A914PNT1_9BILA
MSSKNAALTEAVTLKKFFKWTIPNLHEFNESNMKQEPRKPFTFRTTYVIESPQMTAVDPYDGKKFNAVFKLSSIFVRKNFSIVANVNPRSSIPNKRGSDEHFRYYFIVNDSSDEIVFDEYALTVYPWSNDIKKLTICVDAIVYRSFWISGLARKSQNNLSNRFKEIWKDDSSVKFIIKCGNTTIKTYKPFLAANSFFFKDMFKAVTSDMTEITDAKPKVVQKMVEFCETDNIKEYEGYEDELLKLAHKYQIPDLVEFAVEKMSESANSENIFYYHQLALHYKLNNFEEWCKKFALQMDVNVK